MMLFVGLPDTHACRLHHTSASLRCYALVFNNPHVPCVTCHGFMIVSTGSKPWLYVCFSSGMNLTLGLGSQLPARQIPEVRAKTPNSKP